jgi:hypothetical protein
VKRLPGCITCSSGARAFRETVGRYLRLAKPAISTAGFEEPCQAKPANSTTGTIAGRKSQCESIKKGSLYWGLFVSGGRNAERGMIALRVQDPTARHEEASNDRLLSFWSHKPGEQSYRTFINPADDPRKKYKLKVDWEAVFSSAASKLPKHAPYHQPPFRNVAIASATFVGLVIVEVMRDNGRTAWLAELTPSVWGRSHIISKIWRSSL